MYIIIKFIIILYKFQLYVIITIFKKLFIIKIFIIIFDNKIDGSWKCNNVKKLN